MSHYAIGLSIIFLLLPLHVFSQQTSSPNVTLGSSLTATKSNANNPWTTSPSGDFAFGFIQPTPGTGYLLAIWFNKIPEKTVIWSANRNTLAPEGSTIQLLQDGRFVLNDPTGQSIWDAHTAGAGVAYGTLLDTGNFVLESNTSSASTLWQSFDTPTDTLVPSQMLIENQNIISSFSATNYTSGKFQLIMQTDGNLVLYTTHYPLTTVNFPYWSTQSFGNDFQFVFNQSGNIALVDKNGSLINSVFSNVVPSDQYYQRLTLDYDGVFRHYVYPKPFTSTGGKPTAWSILELLPSNICLRITEDTGGGVCGYNSLCLLGSDEKPVCQCPFGYSFIDPNDSMGGCKPDFIPQSCDHNETGLFGYGDMLNTDWPLSDIEHFQPVTEDWCRQNCLSDCFCTVAIFRGTDCWKKKYPLSNGRIDSSVDRKAMIKIRLGNSTIFPHTSNPKD